MDDTEPLDVAKPVKLISTTNQLIVELSTCYRLHPTLPDVVSLDINYATTGLLHDLGWESFGLRLSLFFQIVLVVV
jgi:hypothetical protein